MKKTTIIAGLIVVLLSGIAIGAVGQMMYMHYRLARMNRLGLPGMRIHALERMSEQLQLDDKQKAAIGAVLAHSYEDAAKLYDKQRPELQRLTDSTIAQMRHELTPDQQKLLQAAWTDFDKRHRKPDEPASGAPSKEGQP